MTTYIIRSKRPYPSTSMDTLDMMPTVKLPAKDATNTIKGTLEPNYQNPNSSIFENPIAWIVIGGIVLYIFVKK